MSPEIPERALGKHIECTLLQGWSRRLRGLFGSARCAAGLRRGPARRISEACGGEIRPFKSTLRWSIKDGKVDDKVVTHAVLKTVAALQVVEGKTVSVVSCQRSPEPVWLKWKGLEASAEGDFFVRSGPGTVKLGLDSAEEYIRTRFPAG